MRRTLSLSLSLALTSNPNPNPNPRRMAMATAAGAGGLPGSLGGPPVAALVPPGECIFGEEFAAAPLLSREVITHDTRLLRFGLPAGKNLGLSTCACILLKCGEADGEPVVRPYTPVSTNALTGAFELLVKVYPDGKASGFLDRMAIGDEVECKHIPFNVKIQYPFGKKKLVMLVGGTGVTPMVQALHAVLGTPGDETEVTMVCGNRSQRDMLGREMLRNWERGFPGRLRVVDVLSAEPEDSDWAGARGFISREILEAHGCLPDDDTMVFVCGPPPMYNALCGPRDAKELTGVLAAMGFSAEQVFKF
uniref:NADH-cytochrome b5 reductase n=1 Tax=Phaeomonas parva TaxID=124430 RepID=A0A6U4GMF3_9STRA|mmetsp:Transcript_31637/g.100465  ORF Transcript_31637/g.100465 Transcript_31637/m.100465 type:complete len:307 (+) Transcript_31637:30-950(+)